MTKEGRKIENKGSDSPLLFSILVILIMHILKNSPSRPVRSMLIFGTLSAISLVLIAQQNTFAQEPSLNPQPVSMAEEPDKKGDKNAPVDLQADSLSHDDAAQTITASGDVVLIQSGRTVKADKVVYFLKEDRAVASGNVEFTDVTGDKHYANNVEFNDALKQGFVSGLQTFLTDGSRFQATTGDHKDGVNTVMRQATYTPCKTCKDEPNKAPIWQIRASEVEHDEVGKRINYKNARFEVKGVPVAYMPYFSHSDGTVKRKSGFLTPSAGYKSENGAFVENSYYWSIAPDKDLTAGMRVMTEEAPMGLLEWRQRWANADLKANGSFTYSDRTDRRGGSDVYYDDELRGNLQADGRWDMNDKWRSGIKLDMASDDQYLNQYDFDTQDVLENEAYLERFSGRDYASMRMLAFQDLRIAEDREDQPNVLPEINANFLGDPNSVPIVGGRWSLDGSVLGLLRTGSDQDMSRLGVGAGWQRRFVSDYGLVTTVNTKVRAEGYKIGDRAIAVSGSAQGDSDTEGRMFGYVDALSRYPVAKQFQNSQMVIEPIASVTVAPDIDLDDNINIPNEDSQDVQIDASNILNANRFPGLDRVEDEAHVTYGMKTGLYAFDGSYGDIFLGQSYRLDDNENPFSLGSGLNNQTSDIVGQISASYQNTYNLDYRFQLGSDDLASQRHEVDASFVYDQFTFSTQYLYASGLSGTDIEETREQVSNAASYYINDQWRIYGAARHDLGEDSGLREAGIGLDYLGNCVSWSVTGKRTLTEEASGDNGTEILFRVGLKNLGEFSTSADSLGGGAE